MCMPVWCLLLLLLCPGSLEMVLDKTIQSRWHSFELGEEQNILKNLKRHSDGTFSSDLTHHLDKMKAKDFVQWLASTKRKACIRDLIQLEEE